MTDFEKAMKELASVEHSNDNSKVLHKNSTELGLTFWGIYQSANPNLPIWGIIDRYLKIEPDIKKCGAIFQIQGPAKAAMRAIINNGYISCR
jgi:hypothetical protein